LTGVLDFCGGFLVVAIVVPCGGEKVLLECCNITLRHGKWLASMPKVPEKYGGIDMAGAP